MAGESIESDLCGCPPALATKPSRDKPSASRPSRPSSQLRSLPFKVGRGVENRTRRAVAPSRTLPKLRSPQPSCCHLTASGGLIDPKHPRAPHGRRILEPAVKPGETTRGPGRKTGGRDCARLEAQNASRTARTLTSNSIACASMVATVSALRTSRQWSSDALLIPQSING